MHDRKIERHLDAYKIKSVPEGALEVYGKNPHNLYISPDYFPEDYCKRYDCYEEDEMQEKYKNTKN